jgi:hypothetical protein
MDYNGVQRSKTRRKMASLPQELVNTRREMHVFVHGLDHCLVFYGVSRAAIEQQLKPKSGTQHQ